jgi:transposase InsO family protein
MPWQETAPMRERAKFIGLALSGLYSKRELSERFGVSRKTCYKWLERYEREGSEGLRDRSRRPLSSPWATALESAAAILESRSRHPTWGPRKLLAWLSRRHPELELPAASTAGALLKRSGLVKPRRQRMRWKHPGQPASTATQPNELWAADFKGQFRTGDARYCYPLTITDQATRYLLRCRALPSVRTEQARPVFERLFREVGLPLAIRTDNGAPFASTGIHGLCGLNVWWLRLGIRHERIEPGRPQQNGAHERMHLTLKRDALRPPAADLRRQQLSFDRFRSEYNHERPHEALGMRAPGALWAPSVRQYPKRLPEPAYPGHFLKRLVSNAGCFRFQTHQVFLSQALAQDWIGLEEKEDGVWGIYFYDSLLGRFDERHRRIYS